MKEYISMWKNILNFKGRATRREYWCAFGINLLIIVSLVILFKISEYIMAGNINAEPFSDENTLAGKIFLSIYVIYFLCSILPVLSLKIRRFHDIGKTGWWVLICGLLYYVFLIGTILEIVFLCTDSKEDNKWGTNSKNNNHIRQVIDSITNS
ncbi:uncharacterized membrane protein YhaH (DUF805 family) [Mobilisporobacter senegalensis]|uniref:Uncharacterized membrane protein YhaH (DUF805 family) n=1 Tax=Mobilisporobacter senegalensis TaxID=1329262 RepID=A0A3N1X565_9FIRM|nr:DUF805 domain-containing protein [Mobilisporobacter senegalensis]ROR21924.1 uncharacterized membrane protein YhaH (DUF805 family) [Mobilisporobacter senegalensis]